jgi:hypothetical protein
VDDLPIQQCREWPEPGEQGSLRRVVDCGRGQDDEVGTGARPQVTFVVPT